MIRLHARIMLVAPTSNSLAAHIWDLLEAKHVAGDIIVTPSRVTPDELANQSGSVDWIEELRTNLNAAEAAIIVLAPDDLIIDPSTSRHTYYPRPNVSYETGYLHAKLGLASVRILADCTHKPDWAPTQPSDLVTVNHVLIRNHDDAMRDLDCFLTQLGLTAAAHHMWGSSLTVSGLRQFPTYNVYYAWLANQLSCARPHGVERAWKMIIEHLQFLADEFPACKIDKMLEPLGSQQPSDPGARQAFWLSRAMLAAWRRGPDATTLLRTITESLDRVAPAASWEQEISNKLLQVLYCDYRGLAEERCSSQAESAVPCAERWYRSALAVAEQLKTDLLRLAWTAYLTFNLARVTADPVAQEGFFERTLSLRDQLRRQLIDAEFTTRWQGLMGPPLALYLRWLRDHNRKTDIPAILRHYKDSVQTLVSDPSTPRNVQEARARWLLLAGGLDRLLIESQWELPPNATDLATCAKDYVDAFDSALGAGYLHKLS